MSGVRCQVSGKNCKPADLTPDTWHLKPSLGVITMHPFLRIGRRKFLRDSALGLGVAPLISFLIAEPARAEQKPGGPAPSATALMMRATVRVKRPGVDRARAARGIPGAVGVARVGARPAQSGVCPGTCAGRGRGRRTALVEPGILAFHGPAEVQAPGSLRNLAPVRPW